jgi:hypothetical protein
MARALTDPGAMPSFLEELGRSEIAVPVFDAVEGEIDPSTFRIVRYAGHGGVAAYTSTDQLRLGMPRAGPCVALTGARLASGWDRSTSLLLNPGGELGIALDWGTVVSLGGSQPPA